MGREMELRHLRYFVAVAEAGSLTVAAHEKLHTAQPSLSRPLAVGFLTGQEIDWLPEVMRVLRDELPNIDVKVSSQSSSRDLGDALMRGRLDVAFLRPELKAADLLYKVVTKEPLVVILPSDHRLASREIIDPKELAGERLLSVSAAPVLRAVIDAYLKRCGIDTKPELEADNLAMAMSLIASTRSVALLPAYTQAFLPWSVTSRPLGGDVPTVDLVVGHNRANSSPILKLFLSRLDDLIARVSSTRAATRA